MSASTTDFVTGFDPTSQSQVTGAELAQMVNLAVPYLDKGLLISTTDAGSPVVPSVPNANITTKWKNYMWIRVQPTTAAITAYLWNPNGGSDATLLQWTTLSSASIGVGTIQGYNIAANTITSANILSIASSLITGSVPSVWLAQLNLGNTAYATNGIVYNNSLVFGDLTGSTLGVPVIAPLAVTLGKIAKQAVAGNITAGQGNIVDNSLTPTQMVTTGNTPLASSAILANAAVDPTANIVVPAKSLVGTPDGANTNQNIAPGDVLVANYGSAGIPNGFVTVNKGIITLAEAAVETYAQVPVVAAGGISYALKNMNTVGRLVQYFSGSYSTPENQNTTVMTGDAAVDLTTSQQKSGIGNIPCANVTSGNTIRIDIYVPMYIASSGVPMWIGLYDNTNTTFIAFGRLACSSGATSLWGNARLSYVGVISGTAGTVSTRNYSIYFGSTNATATDCTLNKSSEGMTYFIMELL